MAAMPAKVVQSAPEKVVTRDVEMGKSVIMSQVAAVGVIALLAAHEEQINIMISSLYSALLASAFFRWDSFEVVQSTACFGMWILLFFTLDWGLPSMRRFRFNVLASLKDDTSSSNKELVRGELLAWKGRKRAAIDEVLWYLVPWMVVDYFFPRRENTVLNTFPGAPDLQTTVMQVFLSLVAYDCFFYAGHRLFHWKNISQHQKHHDNRGSIRAIDAVRHSFWDGTFDVFCSVFALKLVGSHPLCRAIHNVVATFLITESHCGYDFPWSLGRITNGFFMSSRDHLRHHVTGNANFGKFFTFLDRAFGTYVNGCCVAVAPHEF